MKKREAKFGLLFRHWIKQNYHRFPYGSAFELKQTTKNSIPFDTVKEHQIDFLKSIQEKQGLLFKIPDDSRGIKPFDYFMLRNSPGYVVIKFPESFEIITIETFLYEKNKNKKRKSLTWERAKAISVISI